MKKLDHVLGFFLTLCEMLIEAIVPLFDFLCLIISAALTMALVIGIVSIVKLDTASDVVAQLGICTAIAFILGVGYWLIARVFRIHTKDLLFFVTAGFYGGYYSCCIAYACVLISNYTTDELTGVRVLIGLALTATLAFCPQAVKKLKRR
ncbi:MAG: hypothetical protein J6B00_03755 [Alphaproteobacteria bacterium]|nr:hypothetical protein [Alphaproteobacteria bacterium]MBO5284972.1 hypothetical protein [Alphaproteobacteria bacterium]